jgi:hypothetical protein
MRGLILALTIFAVAMAFAFAVLPDADAAQVSKGVEEFSGSVRVGGILYADGNVIIADDMTFYLGDDEDVGITWNEATEDAAEFSGGPWQFIDAGNLVAFAGGLLIDDDKLAVFGRDQDWTAGYDETTSDDLEFTALSADSRLNVLVGNLTVGDGSPGQTINGEDAYIEGLLEVDGRIHLDGGAQVGDNQPVQYGDDSDWECVWDETTTDDLRCTADAAGSVYNFLVGNLAVGDGTPDVALGGEDAYVEGTFEVDGAARFDGAVDMNSTLDVAGALTVTAPGWTPANGANTACSTTCGIATPIIGIDQAGPTFVGPADASADTCLCDGATS